MSHILGKGSYLMRCQKGLGIVEDLNTKLVQFGKKKRLDLKCTGILMPFQYRKPTI